MSNILALGIMVSEKNILRLLVPNVSIETLGPLGPLAQRRSLVVQCSCLYDVNRSLRQLKRTTSLCFTSNL